MKVYLAGPIASQTLAQANGWREALALRLADVGITAYNPLRGKQQFLPQYGPVGHDTEHYVEHPLVRARAITARDRNDVTTADLMVVNFLGYEGKSTGTAVEFGWADSARIPVLVIIEPGQALHPMLESIMDFRVDSLEQALEVICAVLLP